MIKDLIFLSINNIRRRKLRSWLSIIGIFIGVAAVVSLISLSQGLSYSVSEQFKKIGTDKVIVTNGNAFGPPAAVQEKLTDHDLEIIRKTKGVETATGMLTRFINIKFNEKTSTLPFHGISLEKEELKLVEDIEGMEFEKGKAFNEKDKNKAIIAHRLANEDTFFSKKLKLKDKIEIQDKKFEIIGILKQAGSPIEDSHVYLPLEISQDLFDSKNKFDIIFVRSKQSLTPKLLAEKIKEELRKDRSQKKGNEDFTVQTFESITSTFNSIFSIIQIVVIGIVSISLLVGGIGIMNTMYTSVLERTKEIGIMKAVGAKNFHILIIFILESSLLGLVGGILGIIFGFLLSKAVELIAKYYLGSALVQSYINLLFIFYIIIFSITIGIISGVLPALQASKLKPVDALRYE